MKVKYLLLSLVLSIVVLPNASVSAQPYGKGKFGADVPYGSLTSLTISTGGNVAIQLTPADTPVLGTATNPVTVTSTDVVGYKLYIRSVGSTDMTNSPAVIPASGNGTYLPLATNTWGFNTDGSSNFAGTLMTDMLVKTANGPYSSGDVTNFKYGVKLDNSKPAGNYVTSIMYTAAPQTD